MVWQTTLKIARTLNGWYLASKSASSTSSAIVSLNHGCTLRDATSAAKSRLKITALPWGKVGRASEG